jgi:hypothetical protein
MTDPIAVTVTVDNFDPDNHTATFTYSGIGVDPTGVIHSLTGVESVYQLTPAPGSPWTPITPLTARPGAQWLKIDGWTVTVEGDLLGDGASAGFVLSVEFGTETYPDDPTIIMVDPPGNM